MTQPELTQEQMFVICKHNGHALTTIKDAETGEYKVWIKHAAGITWTGEGWEVFENCRGGKRGFVPACAINPHLH